MRVKVKDKVKIRVKVKDKVKTGIQLTFFKAVKP